MLHLLQRKFPDLWYAAYLILVCGSVEQIQMYCSACCHNTCVAICMYMNVQYYRYVNYKLAYVNGF